MEEEVVRARLPEEGEVIGQVVELLGAARMRVKCEDGYMRICRVPGRLRRRLWVKVGDIVIVQPWKIQSNERGDIVWRYKKNEVFWLKKQGYAKEFEV